MITDISTSDFSLTKSKIGSKLYLYLELSFGAPTRLRVSTGVSLLPDQWKDKTFSLSYITQNRELWNEQVSKIEAMKVDILKAYRSLIEEGKEGIHAKDILARWKDTKDKPVRTKKDAYNRTNLADWARLAIPTFTKDEKLIAPGTMIKLQSVAKIIACVEQGRKYLKLPWKGEGPIHIETFSQEDWKDISLLIDRAADGIHEYHGKIHQLPLTTLNAKTGHPEERNFYAMSTKGRIQKDIKQLLRRAKDEGYYLPFPVDQLKRVSKADSAKNYCFNADELAQIIDHRFDDPRKENIRKILLILCFLGCRIEDLPIVCSSEVETYKGVSTITYSSEKTHTIVCAPLFDPIKDFFTDGNRPWMMADQVLNRQLKKILKELGITRKHLFQREQSNGKFIKEHRDINDLVSSHIGRKTITTLLIGSGISAVLVTGSITGHSNRDEAWKDYVVKEGPSSAYKLYRLVAAQTDELPFTMATMPLQQVPQHPKSEAVLRTLRR